ncbi:hypothetical protein AB1L42_04770 [Thalassoglobus sp. JC818]|uniref:hypothetical protein n=1 Tax=Thalassoglobus sp. JC818 TaxID=3232136 RepID=UPI003458CDAE
MLLKRLRRPLAVITCVIVIALIAISQFLSSRERAGNELALAASRIPTETPLDDVTQRIGTPPDHHFLARGVLLNGVTFLDEQNERAQQHGDVEEYEISVWKRGTATAVVYSQDGRVKGHSLQLSQLTSRPAWLRVFLSWMP